MSGRSEDTEAVEFGGEPPTVVVAVYRDGVEVHRELCETIEAAEAVVEEWSEVEGVECTVDDLGAHHDDDEVLDLDAPGPDVESDYPHDL